MTTRTTTSTTKKAPQKVAALALVAAGSSQRMGGLGKKEYLPLNGGSVLSEAAIVFLKTKLFSTVAVVHPPKGLAAAKKAFYQNPLVQDLAQGVNVIFVSGGATRQESVCKALTAIKKAADKNGSQAKKSPRGKSLQAQKAAAAPRAVLIHDGARPFLSQSLVKKTVAATLKYGAAVPALQPVETQKEMDSGSRIARHLTRSSLAAVQTPQGFLFPEILDCHKKAAQKASQDKNAAAAFTDDTEIWDKYSGKKTRVIPGEPQNIKITYPKDLGATPPAAASSGHKDNFVQDQKSAAALPARPTFRIGLGTDLHRLVAGRKLILGGVVLPFDKGEDGHSDGDALLHAITDALLGAAALGDIGSYFPPEDKKWKDADSAKLLRAAWNDVRAAGWRLENLDCVVKLQAPKFLPHRQSVRERIAKILGVEIERVFVKAKTGERVGLVGQSLVVETEAVCLLSKN